MLNFQQVLFQELLKKNIKYDVCLKILKLKCKLFFIGSELRLFFLQSFLNL